MLEISTLAMKIIGMLLALVGGGIIYWRKQKDRTDQELAKKIEEQGNKNDAEVKKLYQAQTSNQNKVLDKLDEVLKGQHGIELQMQQAFNLIENNKENVGDVRKKQLAIDTELKENSKSIAILGEWRKRVDDKLKID